MGPVLHAPGSPWRAPKAARPLRAWRRRQLAALAQELEGALARWQQDWGLADGARVSCEPAQGEPLAAQGCKTLQRSGDVAGWLYAPAGTQGIAKALFDTNRCHGIVAEIAEACLADAWRCLGTLGMSVHAGSACAPLPKDVGPWSGAAAVRVCGVIEATLLLAAEAVQAWCDANGLPVAAPVPAQPPLPLVIATSAIARHDFVLQVQLIGCELDLGSLQRLQIGDVVRLSHPLDAPTRVVDRSGTALFFGHLGRRDGHKAVELVNSTAH